MTVTRRSVMASALGCLLVPRPAFAQDDALSAAVLAVSKSQPFGADALEIDTAEGRRSLKDYRGELVVLNLWAPWCLPCRREMPSLSRLAVKLKGKTCSILPVSYDRKGLEAVRGFYTDMNITNLPALAGNLPNLQKLAGDLPFPSTWIIDAAGLVRWTVTGEAQWDDADTLHWLTSLMPR